MTLADRLRSAASARAALLPLGALIVVALMVVPVPGAVLDVFFVLNIALSLAVLMVALKTERPLDFSAFPTVLLFATMLRLALNVASARAVLVHGHQGPAAAGHVIEAFGTFLIGGEYIVGVIVFVILTIINMVVITKGAGRVSEVSARFTLDALPGKQMAIDADLNAGALTGEEAKARRAEVALEADFYGSMDGASKFTKGDAVAGILILAINLVGGMLIGMAQHGLSLADAASAYVLLAIGDGLVAQVPALLLSLAAAIIVTRVSQASDLGGQVAGQFRMEGVWAPVAGILALLALLPGMPKLIVGAVAAVAGWAAWSMRARTSTAEGEVVSGTAKSATGADEGDPGPSWDEVSDHSLAGLELGYGLVDLVDDARRAPLIARITGMRRQLSRELGFVLPAIRVRDNLSLAPNCYRIVIAGVAQAESEVAPADWLALDSGEVIEPVPGRPTRDPSFGLPALWIAREDRDAATANGYTVVDAPTVIATHLSQLLQRHAWRLLGQDDVQRLLDQLQGSARHLVVNLVPKTLPLATLTHALQLLLEEGVPLREFRRICEAATVAASRTQDPAELAEAMRPELGDLIVARLAGPGDPLRALTLDPELEQLVAASVRADPGSHWPIDPALGARIVEAVADAAAPVLESGAGLALLTAPGARRALRRLLRVRLPQLVVLSAMELPEDKMVDVAAVIGRPAGTAPGAGAPTPGPAPGAPGLRLAA
ncbi:MAG: flagellar biosynthesis protein FlhA [Sphingomonadaceae bacterium]|nr:flagellar biosynthesis protein FlhA [Sphingomonadaceae bacterium]